MVIYNLKDSQIIIQETQKRIRKIEAPNIQARKKNPNGESRLGFAKQNRRAFEAEEFSLRNSENAEARQRDQARKSTG